MLFRRLSGLTVGAIVACGALSAAAVATADAAPRRVYKGKTAQRHPMKVMVRGNSLKILHFKANLRCRDGSTLIVDERGFVRTPIRSNGRFRDIQVGRTDEVFIKGKRRGRVVRGKVRVKDELRKGGVKCKSRWLKFTARVRGGR